MSQTIIFNQFVIKCRVYIPKCSQQIGCSAITTSINTQKYICILTLRNEINYIATYNVEMWSLCIRDGNSVCGYCSNRTEQAAELVQRCNLLWLGSLLQVASLRHPEQHMSEAVM